MRRVVVRALAAALCVGVAALLLLLAVDVRTWSTRLAADDLRFQHDALAPRLWHPGELTPFGLDRSVLGINDDLAYRRALLVFRVGRPLEPLLSTEATALRIKAQLALASVIQHEGDAARRSQAANLVGVLGFAAATQDVGQRITFLNNAITSFREAIVLNPANDDALFNLEYALDQAKEAANQQAGANQRLGQRGGAGLRDTGHGY